MNFFGGGEEQKPQGPDPVFAGKSLNNNKKYTFDDPS
jgi:hypothetical protein